MSTPLCVEIVYRPSNTNKVFTNTKNIYTCAMSTPLCAQIAYRPSAALQQLALHNHLEQTMLGQCPYQHSQICSL